MSDVTIPAGQWRGDARADADGGLTIQPTAVAAGHQPGWLTVTGYYAPPQALVRELVTVQVAADALPEGMGPGWRRNPVPRWTR